MTLHTKILDAARDEVAKEYGYDSWQEVEQSTRWSHKDDLHEEAALLAMEKQAEFFRWASISYEYTREQQYEGVVWHDKGNIRYSKPLTELELYEIWEGQK